jgi:TP901 family phage tail tape measure protein
MSKAGIIAGRAVIVVDIRDLVTKSLKGIQNQLRQFSRNVSRMSLNMTLFGGAASTGGLLLTKQFTAFEDSMLFLKSKLKTTEEAFTSLTNKIRELGRSTSYTAQEVAEGGVFLAQAGFAADEIDAMLQSVLDLARGTRTELPTAARILSNALRTYGIEAKDSARVVSQFLMATDSGTLDLVALSESMKEVQGTFRSFNVSIETSMAFITMLASRSLRGTKAGTSLNAAFLNLASSANKIKEIFGIEVADNWGNLRDPIEIMKEMKEATKGMGNVQKTDLFRKLFNIRGGRTIEPIFSQIDALELLQKRLKMASNQARIAALLMDSGWGGSVRRATSALQDLNITVMNIFTNTLKPLMDKVPGVANAFEQLAKANERLTMIVLLTPPAVLALGIGFLVASTFASKFALILGVVSAVVVGASRGIFALAGAPLNILSQGFAAATTAGRKFDLMLGSLNPDRLQRGKRAGMAKPTSFLGKMSTRSIPLVGPLEAAVKVVVRGLATIGTKVSQATKATYGMVPAWSRIYSGLKSVVTPLVASIPVGINKIKTGLQSSVVAIKSFANTLSGQVVVGFKRLELQIQQFVKRVQPMLGADLFPEFGKSGGKSFLVTWANFEKDVIRGATSFGSAIQRNIVRYFPILTKLSKINLGANLFPNFGASRGMSFMATWGNFEKDITNLARPMQAVFKPLGILLKPFYQIEAVLQNMSTRMSKVAIATVNWVNNIEKAKDAFADLNTAQKAGAALKGAKGIGSMIGGGAMKGITSIGSIFSSIFRAIPFAKIASGGKVALSVLGKGFLGLWNIVKKIDIVRILYNVIMGLKNIIRTIMIVTGSVLRFAMSWNALFLAVDILILFGDKIPVINTSLSNLGKAFTGAFAQIGKIGKLVGPAFKLIQDGILGLQMGQADGFDMITRGVANIIAIIQTQLWNAWVAFVNSITDEIAFVYRTFMSIYEVIMLIIGGIGQMVVAVAQLFNLGNGDELGKSFRENFGSVAKDGVKLMGNMIEGLFVTLVEITRAAYAGLSGMINTVMQYFSALLTVFKVMVQQIPSYAIPGGQGMKDDLIGAINFAQAIPTAMNAAMKTSDGIINGIADEVRMGFVQGSNAFNDKVDAIFDKDFKMEFATPPKIDILDYDLEAKSFIDPDQDLVDKLTENFGLDQNEKVFRSLKEGFIAATTGSFAATRNTLFKSANKEEQQTDLLTNIAENTRQMAQAF